MVTCTPSCFSPAVNACWSKTSLRKGRSFTLPLACKAFTYCLLRGSWAPRRVSSSKQTAGQLYSAPLTRSRHAVPQCPQSRLRRCAACRQAAGAAAPACGSAQRPAPRLVRKAGRHPSHRLGLPPLLAAAKRLRRCRRAGRQACSPLRIAIRWLAKPLHTKSESMDSWPAGNALPAGCWPASAGRSSTASDL